ncbi:hypothetical protein PHYSODRAFT_468736 [Phytophthora sojae]|uniref:G-patch domain-containing protein n=1 Tax=Phytophthora sojae (strain P6497) TaxID=1094619 RepID=G4YN89_PHYSP|nr:hypothetical protein PHYSODRAFT_468736 [Phytophthora sojae]EGZ30042.1 hypothetical protein PHYSODRAFT_468736 [Phytophthora sojae]|eukprot:XP_009517317.1 hypothetical protein PHYSODRAFT_468736 [Phytophthora sojae]
MKRGGVRNQEVTDAQGRRRFHGAFTGGFSAGYYNSVGSEEGWTPRTFSSSRGNRMERVQQRAEDFMDEEDDPLLGKRLETTERYDTLQTGAKRRLQQQQQADQAASGAGAIPGFALPDDWVLPVNDSIGAKLLKQMGWKEGHGIGQRVRRRKFLEEEKEAVENLKLLTQYAQEEKTEMKARDGAEEEEEVCVPPRKVFDVQKAFPKPKLDRYGAGFDPYTNAPEFSRYKQQQEEKQRSKEGPHRQVVSFSDALTATNGSNRATTGYGLSALEEDDDVDVYGTVSMAEFDRVIAPLGAKKDLKRLDSSAQESRRHEKANSRALCSDGRPVLPGFELAASKEKPPKAVNLRLAVPADFKAYHHFNENVDGDEGVTALYPRQPLVAGSGGDQFRATISASIAKRFVSSTSTNADEKSELVATKEPQDKNSRRSQSSWIPKSLLCKRFHMTTRSETCLTRSLFRT